MSPSRRLGTRFRATATPKPALVSKRFGSRSTGAAGRGSKGGSGLRPGRRLTKRVLPTTGSARVRSGRSLLATPEARLYRRGSYRGLGLSFGFSFWCGRQSLYWGLHRYLYYCHWLPRFYGNYHAPYGLRTHGLWLPLSYARCWRRYWYRTWIGAFSCWWLDPYYRWWPDNTVVYGDSYPYYEGGGSTIAFEDSGASGGTTTTVESHATTPSYRSASPTSLARYYVELGDLYLRTRRYTRAAEAYARAVRLVPDDGSLRFMLADALFAIGDFEAAARAVRVGLSIDPTLSRVAVDKREFYGWPADFDKQLAVLRKHLDANRNDSDARLVLAYNLRFSGQSTEASIELRLLQTQLPGDEAVRTLLEGIELVGEDRKSDEKPGKSPTSKPRRRII